MKVRDVIRKEEGQLLVYACLSGIVLGLTAIAYSIDTLVFRKLLGGTNPIVVGLLICAVGFLLLTVLISRGWFWVYRKGNLNGLLYSSGLAAAFGLVAILADYALRFYAADINVRFPESLLFYPAMGFYAEILFQVLPLTLALIILSRLSKGEDGWRNVWIAILVASLFEPVFQVLPLVSGRFPLWFAFFEFLRIFLIIVSQLSFFRRYDFVTMCWFRIVYYLFWHISWGYLRVGLLF